MFCEFAVGCISSAGGRQQMSRQVCDETRRRDDFTFGELARPRDDLLLRVSGLYVTLTIRIPKTIHTLTLNLTVTLTGY